MERHEKMSNRSLPIKRAVIYLRNAVKDEEKIARQEEECIKLLSQYNSIIITTIKEDGISGIADIRERPGLAQALELCESGLAEVLVCHRLDRLSRDPNQLLNLLDRLQRADVDVLTVMEGDIFAYTRILLRETYISLMLLERADNIMHASTGQKRRNGQKRPEKLTPPENLRLFEE